MGKILKISQSGLPLVPDGLYDAKFIGYTEIKNLVYGDAVRLTFEIIDGGYKGAILDLLCPDRFTPRSKLYEIVCIISGETAFSTDLDTLKGQLCKVRTCTVKSPKGPFSRINSIAPFFTYEYKKSEGEVKND